MHPRGRRGRTAATRPVRRDARRRLRVVQLVGRMCRPCWRPSSTPARTGRPVHNPGYRVMGCSVSALFQQGSYALSGSVIIGLGVGVRRGSPLARQVARGPAPVSRDCALDRLTGRETHRHRMWWRCRLRPVDQRSAGPAPHAPPGYWSLGSPLGLGDPLRYLLRYKPHWVAVPMLANRVELRFLSRADRI